MSGILYLVPVPIGDGSPADELAPRVVRIVAGIRDFVVENERSARRFLSRIMPQEALDASSFGILDEHTRPEELSGLLGPLLAGRDAAIISEAGSPCVADPGAALVAAAARAGIRSVPLPGPSAILMAIMASGLGGQRFSFRGYLPPDPAGREAAPGRLGEAGLLFWTVKVEEFHLATPRRPATTAARRHRLYRRGARTIRPLARPTRAPRLAPPPPAPARRIRRISSAPTRICRRR